LDLDILQIALHLSKPRKTITKKESDSAQSIHGRLSFGDEIIEKVNRNRGRLAPASSTIPANTSFSTDLLDSPTSRNNNLQSRSLPSS